MCLVNAAGLQLGFEYIGSRILCIVKRLHLAKWLFEGFYGFGIL